MKQPATSLPWCISNPDGDNDTQVIQMREANPSAVCMGATEGDADYIVHAANAYPRLVAALRETMRMLADVDCGRTDEYKQAAALLADIGDES